MTLRELAELVGGRVVGDPEVEIQDISSLEEATEGQIAFVAHPRYVKQAHRTRASALIVAQPLEGVQRPMLVVDNPYLAYARIATVFHRPEQPRPGVHPRSVLEEDVELGPEVSIGPLAFVGRGSRIGRGTVIGAGAVIGREVIIGEETVIHPNVCVYPGCRIGSRVIVHAGAVIGSDGFGFIRDERGRLLKIPQRGRVEIEDEVEIGANVAIDRATFGVTRIGRGTKIDNLVQIGHNVTVGEDTVIVAQVGISGSAHIGSRVTLAGQVGVAGHLRVGDGVTVGAKSGVTKDIPPGARVSGFPPLEHREWLRCQSSFAKLPELRRLLKELVERVNRLEQRMGVEHA